jgi:hypothetical protein
MGAAKFVFKRSSVLNAKEESRHAQIGRRLVLRVPCVRGNGVAMPAGAAIRGASSIAAERRRG